LIGRYARTLRSLTAQQIGWRIIHETRLLFYTALGRYGGFLAKPDGIANAPKSIAALQTKGDRARAEAWRAGVVAYLHSPGQRDDWADHSRPKLWRYQHQYHEELVDVAALGASLGDQSWIDEVAAFVRVWRAACPPAGGCAWEPYPVARRIIAWSVALAQWPALTPALQPLLGPQVRFLRNNIEWHLGGNHLLADAVALIVGSVSTGASLDGIRRWALQLLTREIDRQLLGDGGYAERTVQYHTIVLHDLLLTIAFDSEAGHLAPYVRRMAHWLRTVRRSDASFPWLNDAAPGEGPSVTETLEFAGRLGLVDERSRETDVQLTDTGWTIVRGEGSELLFEHGPIGPPHQPGHGHSDALSYELIWSGRHVVSDSGVTTYQAGDVRDFERSPRAHATVSVDGAGVDEPWASFRVGARGRISDVKLELLANGARRLKATATAREWRHEREIAFWPNRALVVLDRVIGAPSTAIVLSHIPLAPAFTIDGDELRDGELELRLELLRGHRVSTYRGAKTPYDGWISAGFGRAVPRTSIAIGADPDCVMGYALLRKDLRLEHAGSTLTITTPDAAIELAWSTR
jgi:hypothetical protein